MVGAQHSQKCTDSKCAVHGPVKVRGNTFMGRVVSAKGMHTAIIERTQTVYVPKYERYKKVRVRQAAHNPECLNARENDVVRIGETRKLSKTKAFAVLEVLGAVKNVTREDFVRRTRATAVFRLPIPSTYRVLGFIIVGSSFLDILFTRCESTNTMRIYKSFTFRRSFATFG